MKKPRKIKLMESLCRYSLNAVIMLFAFSCSATAAWSAHVIEDAAPVDVTPSGFSIIWQSSEPATPGIAIYSDAEGTNEITDQLEVIPFPLTAGAPGITDEYEQDTHMAGLRDTLRTLGLMKIRVEGCLPETTYYYQISSETEGGETVLWPEILPVTTTKENSFTVDSKQILVTIDDLGGSLNPAGWIVTAYNNEALFGVSSVVGDGAAANQAFINLSDMFGSDGLNWAPVGPKEITLEIRRGRGNGTTYYNIFSLDFLSSFSVSSIYAFDTSYPPDITILEPSTDVAAGGGSIPVSWEDNDPDSNAVIALYYDTDNSGEDGTLIAEGIEEDPDGSNDSYLWDITGMAVGTYYIYAVITDGTSSGTSYSPGSVTVTLDSTPPVVDASPVGGTYTSAQAVTLNVNETADIYYTLNGSEPTTGSILYIAPIDVPENITIRFMAVDAAGNPSGIVTENYIIEIPDSDSDGDGMPDAWELTWFGTLDRDGTGDFDGDGVSDLDEYLAGTDPGTSNAPTIPEISSPADGAEVTALQPELVVFNSTDPDGDSVTYEFEVYGDQGMTVLTVSQSDVSEGTDTTSWNVPQELTDNSWYYWRVRASDGTGFSQWAYGSFFVNTFNDPPGDFNISSPADLLEVDTLTPTLEITNSLDPDGDAVTYAFEVYADTVLIASVFGVGEGESGATSWTVDVSLDDNTWYSWKSIATDEHGAATETPTSSFFVNTLNDAPSAPVISSPIVGGEVAAQDVVLVVNNASDLDEDVLVYIFELDRVNSFDSGAWANSGEVTEDTDTTSWDISGLEDNALYYWRVKASDGAAESAWTLGSFFVNTVNNAPSIPILQNPGDGAEVVTLTPLLKVNTSEDVDGDSLTYRYEVYTDDSLSNLVFQSGPGSPEWVITAELSDNTTYYWRARAEDEHGAAGGWMNTASFFVNNNGTNDPPEITILEPSTDVAASGGSIPVSWEDNDPDSNAVIALYYDTDNSGEDGTPIAEGIEEDPDDGSSDSYSWDITGMAVGTYYIYAVITDGTSSGASYSPGSVTVTLDSTPPVVDASPVGGTYTSAQAVTLNVNETADIYYTLNGSEPTTGSILYIVPIDVPENITIRFMAVDAAGNPSGIVTENYIIEIPDPSPTPAPSPGTPSNLPGSTGDKPEEKDTESPVSKSNNFINKGKSSTDSRSVSLGLSASDNVGVAAYYASESSVKPESGHKDWKSVTPAKNFKGTVYFNLSEGPGRKTVTVWFKDAEGNVSDGASDNITLSRAGAKSPLIHRFSPAGGLAGTKVAIRGENFSKNKKKNIVRFNGKKARVISVNKKGTLIKAIVPSGARTGPITVKVGKNTAGSEEYFIVEPPTGGDAATGGPVIKRFKPKSGREGATVTLIGKNFSTVKGKNTVKFGSVEAEVIFAHKKGKKLKVKVPKKARTGYITVTFDGVTAKSKSKFKVKKGRKK